MTCRPGGVVPNEIQNQEAAVVAGIVVFGVVAVVMLGIMLYGVFTEGRRR